MFLWYILSGVDYRPHPPWLCSYGIFSVVLITDRTHHGYVLMVYSQWC